MQLYGQTANIEGLNRTLDSARRVFQARPVILFELEYAVQLREAGQPEETLRLVGDRLAGPPLDPVLTAYLHRVMGDTLAHLHRYAEAYEAYEQALMLMPDDILTLNNYGYLLATQGEQLDKAEVMVKRALANEPDQGFILDSLGWIYYQKGDIEQAIRYLEAAVERDATHPELHEHLGDAYRRAGRLAEAVESWQRSLDMDAPNREAIEARIAEVQAELATHDAP
jgi:Tfp pilus assembly protein PilF